GLYGGVSVLLGNGGGTFGAAVSYGGRLPRSVALGDFNGDGKLDLCRRKFKTGKDVRSKPDGSEAVVSQNGWPIRVFGVRRLRHNPKALVRMVNEGDDFTLGRAYRPGAAQEIECEVMIETPLEIEGQMK